ncbi:MAG TPA: TPM domain-containing protein [Verrucomicrobiae bacterium]|nr:TPM domain-containing protein [Verrucomicrobiae bacterium]
MKARDFLKQLRHDDIVAAIREAEKKTSGEIRVFITRQEVEKAVPVAQRHFEAMGMARTRDRNGVLIFVAPRSHQFAVIGDTGVHARCGDEFWTALAGEMTAHFKRSDFTTGIVHAVTKAGDLLARHFPRRPDDTNQLPDNVETD